MTSKQKKTPDELAELDQSYKSSDSILLLKLHKIIGTEVMSELTGSEIRRLKLELKRRQNLRRSKVLQDIVSRCPKLSDTINQIIEDGALGNVNARTKDRKRKRTNHTPKKSKGTRSSTRYRNRNVGFASDIQIEDPGNSSDYIQISKELGSIDPSMQIQSLETDRMDIETTNRKRKRISTRSSARMLTQTKAKKLNNGERENKRTKLFEVLGDTDSEYEDEGEGDDEYDFNDGFVVDDDYDSDEEMLINGIGIDEEVNSLNDDYVPQEIKDKLDMIDGQWDEFNQKLRIIREDYIESNVGIHNVVMANFNKSDSIWFYRSIKRLGQMEGKEKFELEDKIQRRYNLLKTLQNNDMYQSFNKDADRDISKDILESKHSESVKKILLNRMHSATEESSEEFQKVLNWMDTILNLPTETKCMKHNINLALTNLYAKLKSHLHGMDYVIQQILQAVCIILTDPENKGYVLTLVGPPGVGKTTISTLISEAIGMGFGQVSCGSINDRATIMGHNSTYIGAKPGVFTQIQINSGQLDNVILLDEMDKLPDTKMTPILLQVLDRSQNSRFKDEFCPEVPVDLSKDMFIVSVNDLSPFDAALRDRLKVIEIAGYGIDEKLEICIRHIIPKIMKRTEINVSIPQNLIRKCIQIISPEQSGVRDLERFFEDIYEKLLLINKLSVEANSNVNEFYGLPASFNVQSLKSISQRLIVSLTGTRFK